MERIYHLALRPAWEGAPEEDYRAESLATEGFIHCSRADQVARSANRFYAGATGLLVLTIDPTLLVSPLRHEPASSGELFPHVHGPINRSAVMAVTEMTRGPDGLWKFTPGPMTLP
jgi:uncharacterized protein (DUF952 family)